LGHPRGKHETEEEPCEKGHRERFHNPVHKQCHQQTPWPLADIAHDGKIDLHHHRDNHEPDEHGDGKIDVAALPELHATQELHGGRSRLAEDNSGHHAQSHPDSQVAFKQVQPFGKNWRKSSIHRINLPHQPQHPAVASEGSQQLGVPFVSGVQQALSLSTGFFP